MHIITNLIEWPNATNSVFQGCCDAEVEMSVVLDPGDADHEIDVVYLFTGNALNTTEITEIGAIPYTTIPSNSVSVDISPNFVLTQGNQLNIKFKYCANNTIGTLDQIQLTLQCANHGGNHNFQFVSRLNDIVSAYTNIIAESTAIFNDCQGICNVKKDLLHFNNPSSFNLPVTCTLTTTCGFDFFIDGNPIDITDFQMPPGQSVLQISNPGCAVAAPCNFDFAFDFCGNVVNIPVTHDLSYCNPCGLDCRGITINSNPISMPKVTVCPNYLYDPITLSGNWTIGQNAGTWFGITQTVTANYIRFEWSALAPPFTYTDSYYGYPTTFTFSPSFNNTDHLTLYWKIETGGISNPDWEIKYNGNLTGGTPITLVPIGSVTSNTTYQGSIDIPSFAIPTPSAYDGGYFVLTNSNLTGGDYIEIKNGNISLQQVQKPNLVSAVNLDCSTLNTYNSTAVGDSKTVTFQLYYANEFKDFTRVWFNPWMFDATADYTTKYGGQAITEPQSGWVVDVMASWIGTGIYPMTFSGPNNQLNYRAYINLINDHDFEIIFDFFLIQDLKDWVDLYDIDNRRKLVFTENTPLAPYLLNVTNSVYLNQKAMGYLIYIYDPNIIQGFTPTTPPKPVYYECALDRKVMFDVRWWNQGLNGGLPEMSNPTFAFTRNTNPVSQLSTINPTDVTFTVFYPNTIDNVVFWLFDEANTDNSIDFYASYDSSRALIPTVTTPGVIDNHLQSPSQAVTALGGGYYSVSCRIGTSVNPNGSYRLGAICYSSATDVVNSFLSDTLSVKSVPDVNDICCPLDVDVHWLDYMTDHNTSCFMPTLKERVRNRMYIEGGAFNDCLITLGMPAGTNWLDYCVNVAVLVYQKRDNYPTLNERTYFVYKFVGGTRNTAISGNWDLTPGIFISDNGTQLYIEYSTRVLWNDTPFINGSSSTVMVSPMNAYFDRYAAGFNGQNYINFHNITYNWAGQDIYFEYNFVFDISSFVPNAQSVVLTQINQLHPMDYDSNTNPYGQILDTVTITGWKNGTPTTLVGSFCADKYDYLEVEIQETGVLDGKLIATLNYQPFTEYNIKENESYASTSGAAQWTNVEMYDVDSDFVGGVAKFKIDTSLLQEGNYQICAIRLPN